MVTGGEVITDLHQSFNVFPTLWFIHTDTFATHCDTVIHRHRQTHPMCTGISKLSVEFSIFGPKGPQAHD